MRAPQTTPFVTYTIAAIVILIYLLQAGTQFIGQGVDLPALWGMKINQAIIAGQYWRLITPVFLHGSILHIAFNMYALFIFGPGLERYYGHGRFVALFFISGFAGNVASFLFSTAPSLGSSTAIFGLLGAEGVFLYRNRELFGRSAQRALINLITVAVINLVIGMQPGIDNHQVLEIVNMGNQPLALYPGTRICQFIFERTVGKAHYSGRFSKQAKP